MLRESNAFFFSSAPIRQHIQLGWVRRWELFTFLHCLAQYAPSSRSVRIAVSENPLCHDAQCVRTPKHITLRIALLLAEQYTEQYAYFHWSPQSDDVESCENKLSTCIFVSLRLICGYVVCSWNYLFMETQKAIQKRKWNFSEYTSNTHLRAYFSVLQYRPRNRRRLRAGEKKSV